MNPFLVNRRIDLVDFEDLKLFMLEHDNLYCIAVPENRKRQNLEDFQNAILANGPRPSTVTPDNIGTITSVRYGVFVIMHHLWTNGVNFDVLDVGSHIGDFGLKAGSFIRTSGKSSRVITFDPSEAGALVPYSIELNRLENIVKHEMLAVSDTSGLVLFQYSPGHADAGTIVSGSPNAAGLAGIWLKRIQQLPLRRRFIAFWQLGFAAIKRLMKGGKIDTRYSLISHSVDILEYLKNNQINGNLFVKVDIEGYDPRVINHLLKLLPQRKLFIIFEFTPMRFVDREDSISYLKKLSKDFHLFDLFYCPNPTRFALITPDNIPSFVAEIENRQHGYTDLFLLDKRSPACDELLNRLGLLVPQPDSMIL